MIILPKTADNAAAQLASGITSSSTTIPVLTGQGALFPQPYQGTATSTGTATTLNCTGIGNKAGVVAGKPIRNVTDGSWAFILTVSTNSITTTTLQGGTSNTWANTNAWRVDEILITIEKHDSSGNVTAREKALIYDRTSDNLLCSSTSDRGYDGSTAQAFNANDYVSIEVTSFGYEQFKSQMAEIARIADANGTSIATVVSNLASAANGKGASLIGIEDSGGYTAQTNVEGALQELYQQVSSAGADAIAFGDASDGNVTLSGDITVSRDMFYYTLDLNGHVLNAAGFRIFARTIKDSSGGGKIKAASGGNGGNGGNASGTSGGSAGSAGTGVSGNTVPNSLAGSTGGSGGGGGTNTNGGNGGGATGTAVTNSLGSTTAAAGGSGSAGQNNGNSGGSGGTSTGGTATIHTRDNVTSYLHFCTQVGATLTILNALGAAAGGGGGGGSGGYAGGSGAGGGGGGAGGNGGNWFVTCKTATGIWSIESLGGSGGNGGNGSTVNSGQGGAGGGGAGGCGGSGIFIYHDKSGWTESFVLTGGTKGTKGTGFGTASDGNNGASGVAFKIAV